MTATTPNADNDRPQPRPVAITDIRTEEPKAKGLPSRKVLLTAALVLGGFAAFAVMNGMSERPRKPVATQSQAEPHAATVPEMVKSAPATYDAAGFTGESGRLEEPVDRFWGPNGPPQEYAQRDAALEQGGSAPPPPPPTAQVDPRVKERDEARASSILFTQRERSIAAPGPSPTSAFVEPSVHPVRLQPPASRTILQAGAIIPAALQTGLNSDVPGRIVALVTAPVHDSLTGEHVLIPQGARLIGATQDRPSYGDQRIRIVWTRLILPNGWSMELAGLEASDVSGAAGLPAKVDNHLDRVAVASVLSGALSTAANAAQDRESTVFAQSVGDAAAQEAARVGGRIVDRELSVRPTLRVPAGAPVRVL
ncbi:MAG: TrbI/VirB10 family protein, partial [Caulobacterales bacterium]